MLARRPLGQGAASKKYDVLSALGAHACAGTKHRQKLILRFMTLVTARYNWQREEVSIGRSELARLWQVDERTVKRELAKLKALGWFAVKRAPARGRVAVYGIDWRRILDDTRGEWAHIGPDFIDRLTALTAPAGEKAAEEAAPPTVIAFPLAPSGEGAWDRIRAAVHRSDPVFYANWLTQVEFGGIAQGILELTAPTAFQAQYLNAQAAGRLLQLVQEVVPQVHRIFARPK